MSTCVGSRLCVCVQMEPKFYMRMRSCVCRCGVCVCVCVFTPCARKGTRPACGRALFTSEVSILAQDLAGMKNVDGQSAKVVTNSGTMRYHLGNARKGWNVQGCVQDFRAKLDAMRHGQLDMATVDFERRTPDTLGGD